VSKGVAHRSTRQAYAFDEDVVKIALTECAMVRSSARLAAQRLKAKGIRVPRQTLETWMHDTRADDYQEIRDNLAGPMQRKIAVEHEDNALEGAAVTRKLWQKLNENLDKIPERDLAGAVRNTTVAAAVSTDKALETRERPVKMPELTIPQWEANRDELIKLGLLDDTPALDPPDAEVVEDRSPADAERSA
jgi:hypothetical protein